MDAKLKRQENYAGAAILAAGIACFTMGCVTIYGESGKSAMETLTWLGAVGPLSGKVGITIMVWLLVWAVLNQFVRNKPPIGKKLFYTSLLLIGFSLLFTFPPFFELFKK